MSSDGEGSPSLRSTNSGPPPSAQAQQVTAQQLQSSHPLWARSRGQPLPVPSGRGGGGGNMRAPPGRGGGGGSQSGEPPRFEPLSAYQLELDCFRANADGDSALFSEEGSEASLARPPRRRGRQPRASAEEDDDDEAAFSQLAESDDGASDAAGPRSGKKQRGRKRAAVPNADGGAADSAMYAQAAFGGGYGACSACSDGESDSQLSGTSSARKKKAFKAAFPVKGIDCVGCALVKKIAPVEKFIKDHMNKMSEEALWKMAALTYVREVQEPRKREGVLSPDWAWKDVRTHFLLHCSDNTIARTFTVKSLQVSRLNIEARLMRVTDGEREIDKAGCELMLKLIKEESAQRQLLGGGGGGGGSAAGGAKKQPGGSTVGDAK